MDDLLRNLMAQRNIPGLAIGVQRGEDVLHEGYYGYANLEHQVGVRPETVFEIASVTKLFTAQAVLHLAQTGKLKLEDRVADYVADLPGAWGGVTVRHCLAHQSGIHNYTSTDAYWELTRKAKTPAQILDLVRSLPLDFPSGTRHAYDNTGYFLLGLLIEAVTGRPYADYLKERIFEPVGMAHTQGNTYERIIPHRAQGYVYRDDVMQNKDYYDISNTFSAGVLLSNVRDLLKWRASLYDDRILNADTRRLWWTPHPSGEANERKYGYSVGLGWFMVDSELGTFLGHNGGIQGFASALLHFREANITAVALLNASHVDEPHKIVLKVIREMKLL
jgi:CubicO group peptidase (beta-lactamase class C family)